MSNPSSTRPPAPGCAPDEQTTEHQAHTDACACSCGHLPEEDDEDSAPDESEDDFELGLAPTVDSPTPDAIAELCNQCVNYVFRSTGMPLDFTPETLSILDHYLTLARPTEDERPALLSLVANAAGAYFGELVRQRIDGFWLMPGPDTHEWYVCARSVYFKFNPIGVVHEVIAQSSEHPGPGGEFHLARDERSLIEERLAAVPAVSPEHYYLLTTRLEAIDIIIETLRVVMNQGGQELAFEPEDYE